MVTQTPKESVDITPRCSLSYSDLEDIPDRLMLSDNVVNAFQKMMETQFPEANCLQDPIFRSDIKF